MQALRATNHEVVLNGFRITAMEANNNVGQLGAEQALE